MQIHVARQQQQLGVFAPEDIVAGLSSGRFLASDLAWREGMAAWSPLGDWAEFRGAGVPAVVPSMPFSMPAEPASASLIPWEQGKSLGSFFATIKLAIVNPSVLTTGRFAFGDWLVFCYIALAFSLPFQAFRLAVAPDPNIAIAEFLKGFSAPAIRAAAEQMLNTPPTPIGLTIASTLVGLALGPLSYALFALPHWVGQRVFRMQVSVERTVSATLLATGGVILILAPFQLLWADIGVLLVVGCLFIAPLAAIGYFRILGAATGVSPWKQFGISCFVWFVVCCCCCFIPMALFWGAAVNR